MELEIRSGLPFSDVPSWSRISKHHPASNGSTQHGCEPIAYRAGLNELVEIRNNQPIIQRPSHTPTRPHVQAASTQEEYATLSESPKAGHPESDHALPTKVARSHESDQAQCGPVPTPFASQHSF